MAFDPQPHLMKVRGGQLYLEVKWRLIWLREVHPDASVEVELTHLDLDGKMAVARATVTLPNGTKASEIGSETEKDFPAGWVEKAATKAVGRALAALGFGTQFALELDEGDGERIADSPVSAQASGVRRQAREDAPAAPQGKDSAPGVERNGTAPHAPELSPVARPLPPDTDWTGTVGQLRARIERDSGLELRTGQDWAHLARLYERPEPLCAADMTQEWLLALHQEMTARAYRGKVAVASSEDEVITLVREALGDREKRHIGMAHYLDLSAQGEARKAELSAPLLSALPRAVAS